VNFYAGMTNSVCRNLCGLEETNVKLHHSGLSPFVRKVTILAGFLRISKKIELVAGKGNLMLRDPEFRKLNPSGQIPMLVTDEGEALFDSPVICEYLNDFAKGKLIGRGDERWRNLRDQALGDSMCDAALQLRYEIGLRPSELQWQQWRNAWASKIIDTLTWLETRPDHLSGRHDIGAISIFVPLAFIDNRIPELSWRGDFPKVAAWFDAFSALPQVAATNPY